MNAFHTLGSLELLASDGRPVDEVVAHHKRTVFLAYLAMSRPGGLHRRDSLLALFWPEASETAGRHALRQTVYFLRRHLGRDILRARGREEIGIDPERLWCDAVAHKSAHAAGRLERCVELYRGDFMQGVFVARSSRDIEEWIERERASLRRTTVESAVELGRRAEEAGELSAAGDRLRQALRIDPAEEAAARRLIRILQRVGDRKGALEVYERLARHLRSEFELEPAAETEAALEAALRPAGAARAGSDASRRSALPEYTGPLVGRRDLVEEIPELLTASGHRLVTLTGPGGCGKTRLAIEIARLVAQRTGYEALFVSLVAAREPEAVLGLIAEATGLPGVEHGDVLERLAGHLADRPRLLVLDNFEHVVEAAGELVELLDRAPPARLLVTSRSRLRLRAEREVPVPPLVLPGETSASLSEIEENEAVAFFLDRARVVSPGFTLSRENTPEVVGICRRLDGLPLAIELAAARVKLLSVSDIHDGLATRFRLLSDGPRDVPSRHRGLGAAIGWSEDLLDPDERSLFRGLSLFDGGFTLELARRWWERRGNDPDGLLALLASLLEQNLVRRLRTAGGPTRYAMLETIREYGLEATRSDGRFEEVAVAQATVLLDWIRRGNVNLCTPRQARWIERLAEEHDNVHAALRRMEQLRRLDIAARLCASLWQYWWIRAAFAEGRSRIERVATDPDLEIEDDLRARLLLGGGVLANGQGDAPAAIGWLEECVALFRSLGDQTGVCRALQNLGFALREAGDLERARSVFEEVLALARLLDQPRRIATALQSLGTIAKEEGDLARADEMIGWSIEMALESGDEHRLARGLLDRGDVARRRSDFELAVGFYERSLEAYERLDERLGIAESLQKLADTLRCEGRMERASERYSQALELYRQIEYPAGIAGTLVALAVIGAGLDRVEETANLLGGIDGVAREAAVAIETELQREYRLARARIRDRLGEPAFIEHVRRGQAMTLDELVDLALDLQHADKVAPLSRASGQ